MALFKAGAARAQFGKQMAHLISECQRMRWQPVRIVADHNLMIDVFGSQGTTMFAGMPVEALPLTYGRDHIMLAECTNGVRVGLYADGRTERIGEAEA